MPFSSSSTEQFKRDNPHTIILTDPSLKGLDEMITYLDPEEMHFFFNLILMIKKDTVLRVKEISTCIPQDIITSNEMVYSSQARTKFVYQERKMCFNEENYEEHRDNKDFLVSLASKKNQQERLKLAKEHYSPTSSIQRYIKKALLRLTSPRKLSE